MHNSNYFSINVKRLRLEKGLSRKQLELLAGVKSITMIETQRRGTKPGYCTVVAIAKALNVSPETLFAAPKKRAA